MVRPGELNLMTAGHGICHSEVSTATTTVLHGVQLWIALPDAHRDTPPAFEHHVPGVVTLDGATARVFLGTVAGETSPVRTFTPLLGAEILLEPGARPALDVDPAFEHGVLVDVGAVELSGTPLARGTLGHVGVGTAGLRLANVADTPARVILLGGEPLGEDLVMWWNFVGRSHDEIVRYREQWQQESARFGRVEGYAGDRLPAPPMPTARLRPRTRP
jgi:redox-sensitive bicupin YhaK (pirin superfamily)